MLKNINKNFDDILISKNVYLCHTIKFNLPDMSRIGSIVAIS